MLPSHSWKTIQQLESDDDSSVKAWPAVASKLDAIERIAADLRRPHACIANRQKYASGTAAIAVEVVFDDGVAWIVRLRTDHVPTDYTESTITRSLESEVATMTYLKQHTNIPVPTIYGHCTTADNVLGFPYLVMSAIVGYLPSDLGLNLLDAVPADKEPILARYCSSLADIHSQLSSLRADKIGSLYLDPGHPSRTIIGPLSDTGMGPYNTINDYYHANAERLEHVVLMSAPDDTPAARERRAFTFWLYRLFFAASAFESPNSGPFILTHMDLVPTNTIVDETGKIIGILDWDTAAFLPAELFATQMIVFLGSPDYNLPDAIQRYSAYQAALANRPRAELPGNQSLAALHESVTCRLLRRMHYFMAGRDNFDNSKVAQTLCKHLFGVEDEQLVVQSPVFREWLKCRS